MANYLDWRDCAPVLETSARLRQKATMNNEKGSSKNPIVHCVRPRKYDGANKYVDAEITAQEHRLESIVQTSTLEGTDAKSCCTSWTALSLEGAGETAQQTVKDLTTSKELQEHLKECRQAKKQLFEAVEEDRANYEATIRDVKLLCVTANDADLSKTQKKICQYHEVRSLLAYKDAADGDLSHEKRLILDQLTSLNAELEFALAERQSAFQRRTTLGIGARQTSSQPSRSRNIESNLATPPRDILDQRDGTKRAVDELLATVTRLQQENQQLHEENVRLRRALAATQASHCEPGPERGRSWSPHITVSVRPTLPEVKDQVASSDRLTSGSHQGTRRWQNIICPAKTRRYRRVGEQQIRALLQAGGIATIEPLWGTEVARSLIGAFRVMSKKCAHFKKKNFTLQSKCNKQRRLSESRYNEAVGPLAEPGKESFTVQWKVGILEAEITRLRRLLELSAGTSLSLATIHRFFLEQKAALQRQAITEVAAIDALKSQFEVIEDLSLACGYEDDTYESSDDLSGLVGHTAEISSSPVLAQHVTTRQFNNSALLEKAFRATFDAAVDALETLKGRHAETDARLAQIQSGIINVEQDLKLLGKEQRLETEKHIKELSPENGEPDAENSRGCYRRQLVGPNCAERETQTNASGIASRRLLYTGEYRVSDSATCPVSIFIVNEEDIVVKLMLDDMEHPPCLYMAFAGIKFLHATPAENTQVADHATRALAAGSESSDEKDTSRAETARRPPTRRRRVPDQADGQSIAEMLDVEHVRGVPCLILKGQEVGIPGSQDPRPHTDYEEECLYNDKLAIGMVCPVHEHPLMLQVMQCARRRFGMLFFHLCVYNSVTGWLKYASVASKDLCRRFGYPGDRDLLEAIGNIKRHGKVAQGDLTKKVLELFEDFFETDLALAASSSPAVPVARTFSPRMFVLYGGLSADEKGEITRQKEREKVKQSRSCNNIRCAEPALLTAVADGHSDSCEHSVSASQDPEPSRLYGSVALKPPTAYVFIYLKICITWDCDVDVLLGFE